LFTTPRGLSQAVPSSSSSFHFFPSQPTLRIEYLSRTFTALRIKPRAWPCQRQASTAHFPSFVFALIVFVCFRRPLYASLSTSAFRLPTPTVLCYRQSLRASFSFLFLLRVLARSGSRPLSLKSYSNSQAWNLLQRYSVHSRPRSPWLVCPNIGELCATRPQQRKPLDFLTGGNRMGK